MIIIITIIFIIIIDVIIVKSWRIQLRWLFSKLTLLIANSFRFFLSLRATCRDTALNDAFFLRRGVLEVCHGICVPIPCAVCVGVEVIVPGGDGTKAGPDSIRTVYYRLGWGHEHLAFSAGIWRKRQGEY